MRAWVVLAVVVGLGMEMMGQQGATKPSTAHAKAMGAKGATAAGAGTMAAITDPREIQSKPNAQMQKFSIEQLYATRQVGATAWSPDGRQIAFISNMGGTNNLWLVPSDGGWPTQLTISKQRQAAPAWSPDGKYIVYESDYNGNEQWDLFLVEPGNGKVTNITNTPNVSEEAPAWSPDGKLLAYASKPKDGSSYEINLMEMLTRTSRAMTENTPKNLSNYGPVWSHDGKWIAYEQSNADGRDSNIFVLEVATGKSTNVTPHEGERLYETGDWSPDGKQLLITSNAGNGYMNAGLLEVATKKIEWLTQAKSDVQAGNFSPDGKRVTWTVNEDGNASLVVRDLARKLDVMAVRRGVNSPGGAESAFTKDGKKLLFYHNGATAPSDVWVYDFTAKQSQQVTRSLVGGLRSSDMVDPQLVHYPSRDGKFTISAFVYTPYNAPRDGTHPLVLYIHGGPTAQWMNGFNRMAQYLANEGYVVMAPNYRGSTGYGREFMDANRYDMGGGDLDDVLAGAAWMEKSGYIDPKKLVVMGGSYGGYLTMMAVTKHPEMWAAGVAIVPFVNWFTEIQNEDPVLREYDLATMGNPDDPKDKARLEERSPINYVDDIKAPLLMLAGGNDPRCPKSETMQVVDAVKKRGGTIDYKIYEDEGHGFARVANQIDAYQRVADFILQHVPAPDCGCTL